MINKIRMGEKGVSDVSFIRNTKVHSSGFLFIDIAHIVCGRVYVTIRCPSACPSVCLSVCLSCRSLQQRAGVSDLLWCDVLLLWSRRAGDTDRPAANAPQQHGAQ